MGVLIRMGDDDLVVLDVRLGSIGLCMTRAAVCPLLDGVVRALMAEGMGCWSCGWGHA